MAKTRFKFGIKSIPAGKEPPIVRRIKAFLDKAPYEQLYTNHELAALVGYSYHHIRSEANLPELQDYRQPILVENTQSGKHNMKIYWGSMKTIATYRKENL